MIVEHAQNLRSTGISPVGTPGVWPGEIGWHVEMMVLTEQDARCAHRWDACATHFFR